MCSDERVTAEADVKETEIIDSEAEEHDGNEEMGSENEWVLMEDIWEELPSQERTGSI